jgi:EmrB/QacA subfamily drug resistance transporter
MSTVEQLRARLGHRPEGYRLTVGRVLAVYTGLMLVMFISSADQTIVATALPTIAADFDAVASYAWIFSAYMLAATISVPLWGKLSDVYGKRRLLLCGVTVFTIGSVLCGTATSMAWLTAARAVQGLGAGGLVPLALATIPLIVPLRDRGRYQGLMVGAWASGAGAGPLIGGLIVDHASWRWIFFATIPFCLLAAAVIATTMRGPSQREVRPIDWLGAGLLAGASGGLLVGFLVGSKEHDWANRWFVVPVAIGVVLAVAFARVERRVREPILPLPLLQRRAVTASVASYALGGMVTLGVITFLPLFVQGVIGGSATASGLVLWPLMLGTSVTSFIAGQLISRSGRVRAVAIGGPFLMTAGMLLIATMGADASAGEVARNTALVGAGWGLMAQVFIITVQNEVPRSLVGSATAMMVFSRTMGAALGVAFMGAIVNARLPEDVRIGGGAVPVREDSSAALASALEPAFIAAACAAILILPLTVWGIGRVRLRATVEDDPPAPAEALPGESPVSRA